MKTTLRRLNISDEHGATLVETALASIVSLIMLLGLIQMSMALYTYHYISDAARNGTRWAIVHGSNCMLNTPAQTHCNAQPDEIRDYVRSLGYPGINAAQRMDVETTWLQKSESDTIPPTATWSDCGGVCNQPGNQVRVTVTYHFPLGIPFLPSKVLDISSTSTMAISQ